MSAPKSGHTPKIPASLYYYPGDEGSIVNFWKDGFSVKFSFKSMSFFTSIFTIVQQCLETPTVV